MADPPPYSTPRWVVIAGIITLVLVLLFAIMMLVGGSEHGPGRHKPSGGGPSAHTPPRIATEYRVQQP